MALTSRNSKEIPATVMGPRLALLLSTLALLLIGLVMVYSASSVNEVSVGNPAYVEVLNQLMYAGLGVVAAFILWKFIPYHFWVGPGCWAVWGIGIALLILTWLMGISDYGAQRWLQLGPIGMQPSEFTKITFLLMAIRILYLWRSQTITVQVAAVQALLYVLVPIMFMYSTQSDLGTTLICMVGIFAVMWIGGVDVRWMLAIAIAAIAFVLFAVFGTGYRSDRLVYLDPWNDGMDGYGAGYNIIRSYYALAAGGLFGVGLGNSHEKYQYLFSSESDFIFAVIGEELGLVGAMLVIGLFLLFLYAGLSIARNAPDELGTMIAGGFVIMIVFQAFLNIGCVVGVFPTTGKPLPFISSGGSSLVATMIMVGLILSVSHASGESNIYDRRRADLRVVRSEGSSHGRSSYGGRR